MRTMDHVAQILMIPMYRDGFSRGIGGVTLDSEMLLRDFANFALRR